MNKLGQYHDDERGHYSFNFSDSDGKHITMSFRAEQDYDLDIVFNEFRNFLIASGHDVEGEIGELFHHEDENEDDDDSYAQSWGKEADDILLESIDAMKQSQRAKDLVQNPTQSKFSMDHLPNNGWPFGALTTTDISSITSTDWSSLNQYPTMAPLTQENVESWNLKKQGIQALSSADIEALTFKAPGTIGGAKVNFK